MWPFKSNPDKIYRIVPYGRKWYKVEKRWPALGWRSYETTYYSVEKAKEAVEGHKKWDEDFDRVRKEIAERERKEAPIYL